MSSTPVRRPAAFAPGDTPRPICPICWSAPRIGSATNRRGWRVQVSDTGDARVAVYACSNAACRIAIEVRTTMQGGYVARDVVEHQLTAADAERFRAGRVRADGVWRDDVGDLRTAPVQRDLFHA
jgi:hypothetical protein